MSARIRVLAGMVALVVASCSAGLASPVASPTTATPASTSAPATSTIPPATSTTTAPDLVLVLDETERLALRGGVTLRIESDGQPMGSLSDAEPRVSLAGTGGGAGDLVFTYIGADGAAGDVSWTQHAAPGVAELVVVQPWREAGASSGDVVLAWQRNRSSLAEATAEVAGLPLTAVSPLWWNINDEAELTGRADPDYVAAMQGLGLLVWPAVQGLHADGLHVLLNDPELRRSTIAELSDGTRASGADGFNIDLEGFRDEDGEAFSVFVEELAAAVHEWGGTVSYDLVPRSDTWDVTPPELAYWSTAPQRRRLAAAVDYTVLMTYDQHNRYRPAGPVAAPAWVEEMVIYQLRYSDPHEIVLGLPAYGRLWDPEELDAPRALGFGALRELGGERSPDPTFAVDRLDLDDGRFYWADHEVTPVRVALGEAYGLSGVAVWRLGLDDSGLWEALR